MNCIQPAPTPILLTPHKQTMANITTGAGRLMMSILGKGYLWLFGEDENRDTTVNVDDDKILKCKGHRLNEYVLS